MVYFIIQIQQLQKLVKMKENMKNKFNYISLNVI